MKKFGWIFFVACTATFFSCQKENDNANVVSQRYVHKYGFDLSEGEWKKRDKDGQVISVLDNGVTVCSSFANGILHGPTTHTFPHGKTIEKLFIYDEGMITKKILHDLEGIPYKEESYEIDNKKVITLWNKLGVPLSIEEYEKEQLTRGKYFNPENEVVSIVEDGKGLRTHYNREGLLLSKENFENGQLIFRTTYHANGQIQSKSPFLEYKLHGKQMTYTSSGKPLLKMKWNNGLIHGKKTLYRNGKKVHEIPYIQGEKHGAEFHYDLDGEILAEIHWEKDKRHGSSRYYYDEDTKIEWYYHGECVGLKKFKMMELRDQMIADIHGDQQKLKEEIKDTEEQINSELDTE